MRYTFVLCVVVFLAGCGGGDASGPSAAAAAAETCQTFIEAQYCPKVELCFSSVTHADCVGSVSTELDCGTAQAVAENFPRCQRDLAALTCPVFASGGKVNMPASCTHIFLHYVM